MDMERLFDLLIDAKNNFLYNPWAQDSTFLFVGVVVERLMVYPAHMLFNYNRLTNGEHKDALFNSGLFSVILSLIALSCGVPNHHINRLYSFFSFLISSICGSLAVLLILMKQEVDENRGYYYRAIGFLLAMYNFVCALYYRVAIQIYPFAAGLICYNVGSTILVFHETRRKFE